jgi:hypothetical protein
LKDAFSGMKRSRAVRMRSSGIKPGITAHHHSARNGEYRFTSYRVIESPANLVRMGLATIADTKTGIMPRGVQRTGGLVCLELFADEAIDRDLRFRRSLDRVLFGRTCPNFNWPISVSRRAKPKRPAGGSC